MYWNGDWSWAAWSGMVLMMVVFWGGLAVALVIALRGQHGSSTSSAESRLADRLADGEITAEEYRDLRDTIRR